MRGWKAWVPAVLYAGLIFAVSSIPARSMPDGQFWDFDKVIHAAEYAVLAALVWWALGRTTEISARSRVLVAALIAGAYGVSDELHQSLVPGRFASSYDVLADVGGAVCAALALWLWSQRRASASRTS